MADLSDLPDEDLAGTLGMSFVDRKRFRAAVAGLTPGAPAAPSLAGATRVAPSGATPIPSLAGATRIESSAALPQQLGSYRVLGLLGTGGMGTVVRARHVEEGWAQQQGGDVAIKLIHPQIATDPEFRSRFMSEAALGRKVQHPGFVPTFDVISEGAWLGTVMSFVTGEPLGSKVVPGGLSVDAVIALLSPIGEALDYLHGLGIVHRDLKPANIVVQPNGRPVVLDLGIAKDMQAGGNHTRTMTTMGTSAWMAPEQADAKHVDGAADRYAFGMIAYVLLAGQMPWPEGASEARVFSNKLMGQLVPLAQVRAGVPQHVSAAVMKMVSLEAGERYSTCGGFVKALRVDEGAAMAAVSAPPPAPTPWYYAGSDSAARMVTVADIVSTVLAAPHERHLVWKAGMGEWLSYAEVPAIAAQVRLAAEAAAASTPHVPPRTPPPPASAPEASSVRSAGLPPVSAFDAGITQFDSVNAGAFTRALSARTGLPVGAAWVASEAIVARALEVVNGGEKFQIWGFGSMMVSQSRSFMGHSPRNGREICVPSRRVPLFRAARWLRPLPKAVVLRKLGGERNPVRSLSYWAPKAVSGPTGKVVKRKRAAPKLVVSPASKKVDYESNTRRSLALYVHQQSGMPLSWAVRFVHAWIYVIVQGVVSGEGARVPNLGHFQIIHRRAHVKHNPKNGKALSIAARTYMHLRFSRRFAAALQD